MGTISTYFDPYCRDNSTWQRPDIYKTASKPWANSPNPQPFTYTDDMIEPDPCMEKHVLGEITQYPDGVFGNCVECGERVELPTVPGGYTAMQIRGFLERVIAGENPENDGELLAELGSLLAILNVEKDELELALKRIEIAREILETRSEL